MKIGSCFVWHGKYIETKLKNVKCKLIFRTLRKMVGLTMRGMYWAGSVNYIKVKGKQATTKEAPILLGAPHTSFFDALGVIITGPASVVAKVESGSIPFYGSKVLFLL